MQILLAGPQHCKDDIGSFFTAARKTQFSFCLIVSTTDKWSESAEHALLSQSKPIFRLLVQGLDASPVDWSKFILQRPQDIGLRKRKTSKDHQTEALQDVVKGLDKADRGKLITVQDREDVHGLEDRRAYGPARARAFPGPLHFPAFVKPSGMDGRGVPNHSQHGGLFGYKSREAGKGSPDTFSDIH
ncbi:MAG: hypothetical protein JNK54_10205 [Elusimicrobia bacterium]|jgi:hypothetical protein|nr:hypothetical protein [Elusimicrobiota bacterium]